jgi:ribosomal protein S27E
MARKCPQCGSMNDTYSYDAWVVRANGQVTFDGDGIIVNVGPAVASTVVKPGKELRSPGATLTCPDCGHRAAIKAFTVQMTSYLSGVVATHTATLYGLLTPVTEEELSHLSEWFPAVQTCMSDAAVVMSFLLPVVPTATVSTASTEESHSCVD